MFLRPEELICFSLRPVGPQRLSRKLFFRGTPRCLSSFFWRDCMAVLKREWSQSRCRESLPLYWSFSFLLPS